MILLYNYRYKDMPNSGDKDYYLIVYMNIYDISHNLHHISCSDYYENINMSDYEAITTSTSCLDIELI